MHSINICYATKLCTVNINWLQGVGKEHHDPSGSADTYFWAPAVLGNSIHKYYRIIEQE